MSRVALTLKVVGGFGVGEIARAFLMQEPAVAQRLVRAKRTLREHDVPFALPAPADVGERLVSVLDALYLMFNEGLCAPPPATPRSKEDVAEEAMRLVTLLARHPETARPETHALRALMLLHAARFPGGSSGGVLRLLAIRTGRAWDARAARRRACARSTARPAARSRAASTSRPAIAAAHAAAPDWARTDWPHILSTATTRSSARWPSPVAALNRVIALAQVAGAEAALAAEPSGSPPTRALARYHLLPAVLAELCAPGRATRRGPAACLDRRSRSRCRTRAPVARAGGCTGAASPAPRGLYNPSAERRGISDQAVPLEIRRPRNPVHRRVLRRVPAAQDRRRGARAARRCASR